MKLKIIGFLGLIFTLTCKMGFGQVKPTISNINIEVTQSGKIEIRYDISDIRPNDSLFVTLQKKDGIMVIPKSVIGDIGKNLVSGKGKKIIWNIIEDNFFDDGDYQSIIEIKLGKEIQAPKPQPSGGVSNVLLSVIAPGIGNIFVNENKKVGLRPLATVAFYSLLLYSLTLKKEANNHYAIYNSKLNEKEALPYYDIANENHHSYIMLSRAAAIIWAVEVISTFAKGLKNDKLRKQSHTSLKVDWGINNTTIGFRYTF